MSRPVPSLLNIAFDKQRIVFPQSRQTQGFFHHPGVHQSSQNFIENFLHTIPNKQDPRSLRLLLDLNQTPFCACWRKLTIVVPSELVS
ncbi:unnamed protein product [Allacma fusca]|uniref:Uncharacterized protein n=1 Tax=Allacma fusca TaxID=39272 RepID=A0A8J2L1L1_9HEXA|nr:unnamed protein product [Allacma fusca]